MALVAYENSDSSDYEDGENENTTDATTTILDKPKVSKLLLSTPEKVTTELTGDDGPSLFNLLPQPSAKKPVVVEEDDEFLHKKEKTDVKPKAKITVPSLRDFKDIESSAPIPKPKVANGKASGLLSILPQPRNGFTTTTSKSFMPHVLTQNNTRIKKKDNVPSPAKKPKKLLNNYSDESDIDDDDDDVQNDFFSMNKPLEVPVDIDTDQNINKQEPVNRQPEKWTLESYFKKDLVETSAEPQPVENFGEYATPEAGLCYSNGNADGEGTSNSDNMILDEEAILKLCGAHGKRKKEDIQIVDVNQKDMLADAREWLLKGLMDDTTKRVSSSKRKGNEPTSQQKRKHQITYLAHQAKANEAELQNQWANSRMSRRQTQNKYGF